MYNNNSPVDSTALHKAYDICVITAANEYQAQGYRQQVKWRKDRGALPEQTEFLVFSDPQGKRVGSGGSTIYVLYELLERFCSADECEEYQSPQEAFKGKRILILHSGGDSKRLPAYSAVGKALAPLPTSSSPFSKQDEGLDGFVAIFDLLLDVLMQLPRLNDGQMVIASGDVLLNFDTSAVVFGESGITGLTYPGRVEVASKHGVYIVPQNQQRDSSAQVMDFLQKPSYDELRECNALDAAERAFVDTGIMNFSIDAIATLMDLSGISLENGKPAKKKDGLCEALVNAELQMDIYQEVPFALLGKNEPSPGSTERQMKLLAALDKLQQVPFYVNLLPYCEFFHIGTSRQLLQGFHTINYTASAYDFQNYNRTGIIDKSGLESVFIYNSMAEAASIKANGSTLIEGCYLDGQVKLDGENILTGIPKNAGDIELQRGVCITCVPVSHNSAKNWVSIIYGINDDFKKDAQDESAVFLNNGFIGWMESKGILPDDLWEDGEIHNLWDARLFPLDTKPAKSIQTAFSLQTNEAVDKWRETPRMSLRSILKNVNYERLLDNYSDLCQKVNIGNLSATLKIQNSLSSERILSWCNELDDCNIAANKVLTAIEESSDMSFQARLYKLLSNILRKADGHSDAKLIARIAGLPHWGILPSYDGHSGQETSFESWIPMLEDVAFGLVREAIGAGLENKLMDHAPGDLKIHIRSDEVVWVCTSARLDFGGGWSDTPPYCLDHGGSVLNAAVRLNGQYPIQAIGKLHPELSIKINSIDLGSRVVISETSEITSYNDPSEWSTLPKAAFVAAGIIPEKCDFDLQDILKQLGSGINITLFSAVPAGSGLGTSSILGSAVIACLSRMFGKELTQEDIFNRTLYMEQLMTTGGGWQDQIGGVVGGTKHIQTESGLFQIPRISWTSLQDKSSTDISDRFLLYYTGYRRMAKNILRNIVGQYLDRVPIISETITELREKSIEAKQELDRRNIDNFGSIINDVWKLNKTLDPGTSNDDIEAMLDSISHLIHGGKLLGAGGGGFLFVVTKGVEESQEIKKILTKGAPNNRARFFDFEVDPDGLKVSVL